MESADAIQLVVASTPFAPRGAKDLTMADAAAETRTEKHLTKPCQAIFSRDGADVDVTGVSSEVDADGTFGSLEATRRALVAETAWLWKCLHTIEANAAAVPQHVASSLPAHRRPPRCLSPTYEPLVSRHTLLHGDSSVVYPQSVACGSPTSTRTPCNNPKGRSLIVERSAASVIESSRRSDGVVFLSGRSDLTTREPTGLCREEALPDAQPTTATPSRMLAGACWREMSPRLSLSQFSRTKAAPRAVEHFTLPDDQFAGLKLERMRTASPCFPESAAAAPPPSVLLREASGAHSAADKIASCSDGGTSRDQQSPHSLWTYCALGDDGARNSESDTAVGHVQSHTTSAPLSPVPLPTQGMQHPACASMQEGRVGSSCGVAESFAGATNGSSQRAFPPSASSEMSASSAAVSCAGEQGCNPIAPQGAAVAAMTPAAVVQAAKESTRSPLTDVGDGPGGSGFSITAEQAHTQPPEPCRTAPAVTAMAVTDAETAERLEICRRGDSFNAVSQCILWEAQSGTVESHVAGSAPAACFAEPLPWSRMKQDKESAPIPAAFVVAIASNADDADDATQLPACQAPSATESASGGHQAALVATVAPAGHCTHDPAPATSSPQPGMQNEAIDKCNSQVLPSAHLSAPRSGKSPSLVSTPPTLQEPLLRTASVCSVGIAANDAHTASPPARISSRHTLALEACRLQRQPVFAVALAHFRAALITCSPLAKILWVRSDEGQWKMSQAFEFGDDMPTVVQFSLDDSCVVFGGAFTACHIRVWDVSGNELRVPGTAGQCRPGETLAALTLVGGTTIRGLRRPNAGVVYATVGNADRSGGAPSSSIFYLRAKSNSWVTLGDHVRLPYPSDVSPPEAVLQPRDLLAHVVACSRDSAVCISLSRRNEVLWVVRTSTPLPVPFDILAANGSGAFLALVASSQGQPTLVARTASGDTLLKAYCREGCESEEQGTRRACKAATRYVAAPVDGGMALWNAASAARVATLRIGQGTDHVTALDINDRLGIVAAGTSGGCLHVYGLARGNETSAA